MIDQVDTHSRLEHAAAWASEKSVMDGSVRETQYGLTEGQVGFGVSSFNVLPIEVAVESFTIE